MLRLSANTALVHAYAPTSYLPLSFEVIRRRLPLAASSALFFKTPLKPSRNLRPLERKNVTYITSQWQRNCMFCNLWMSERVSKPD